MRGKGIITIKYNIETRITPAYAGKSIDRIKFFFGVRDHPRLCGEKLLFPLPIVRVIGSPPPMRGKVGKQSRTISGYGITPAYAGKRLGADDTIALLQDHPRLCGEKFFSVHGMTT